MFPPASWPFCFKHAWRCSVDREITRLLWLWLLKSKMRFLEKKQKPNFGWLNHIKPLCCLVNSPFCKRFISILVAWNQPFLSHQEFRAREAARESSETHGRLDLDPTQGICGSSVHPKSLFDSTAEYHWEYHQSYGVDHWLFNHYVYYGNIANHWNITNHLEYPGCGNITSQ